MSRQQLFAVVGLGVRPRDHAVAARCWKHHPGDPLRTVMQGGGFDRRQRRAMILQAGHDLELNQGSIHMTTWMKDSLALLIIGSEVVGSYPGEATKLLARAADLGDVEAIRVMVLLDAEIKASLAAEANPGSKPDVA